MRPYAPIAATLLALIACTPKRVTHAAEAKQAAAAHFGCELTEVRIREETVGVFLVEACGEIASFYCSEGGSLDLECTHVDDPREIEGETLVDVLAGYDKREAEEKRRRTAPRDSASSVAKTNPPAPAE